MDQQTPNLLQTGVPVLTALGGGYVGRDYLSNAGMGLGALAGALISELVQRSQNRSFLHQLKNMITHEDAYNQQLAILAGALLGGGLGSVGGTVGGGLLGHRLGQRMVGM
jgi:uncharacterized membrane protein